MDRGALTTTLELALSNSEELCHHALKLISKFCREAQPMLLNEAICCNLIVEHLITWQDSGKNEELQRQYIQVLTNVCCSLISHISLETAKMLIDCVNKFVIRNDPVLKMSGIISLHQIARMGREFCQLIAETEIIFNIGILIYERNEPVFLIPALHLFAEISSKSFQLGCYIKNTVLCQKIDDLSHSPDRRIAKMASTILELWHSYKLI